MTRRRFLVLVTLLTLVIVPMTTPAAVLAQDGTPPATPVPECVAPELPPGTPTPMDEGSPAAGDAEATPPDAVPAEDEEAAAEPLSEGPASRNLAEAARAGFQNVLNCIAAGDLAGLAGLMTPNFVTWLTETGNPYDVPAMMEGVQPMRIVQEGDIVLDSAGRVGIHIVYGDFFNAPGVLTSERWYLVRDGDYWKVDAIAPVPAPAAFLEGYTIVDVEMVDFAFALSMNEIPTGPVIFRMTNTSYSGSPHVGVIVTLAEGMTAEQVIQMDALPDEHVAAFFGATFLEAGQSADMIFEDLHPGVYTLVCDVVTPSGVEHWKLGMVAQFDVV